MKILILSTHYRTGGAAIAAHRLYSSLKERGADVHYVHFYGEGGIFERLGFKGKLLVLMHKAISKMRNVLSVKKGEFHSFSPFSNRHIVRAINAYNADIIHLHWVCGSFLSYRMISALKGKVHWTLHDLQPVTGGRHYTHDCLGFLEECRNCPQHKFNDPFGIAHREWKKKRKANLEAQYIGVSNWIREEAAKASVVKQSSSATVTIPNTLGGEQRQAGAREHIERVVEQEQDVPLLLYGAQHIQDPRKGFKELCESLMHIEARVELAVFGNMGANEALNTLPDNIKVHYVGTIRDQQVLHRLYKQSHLLVFPSMQENLSNIILESLSASTAVVAFDIGGNSDMIEHMVNGYLAPECTAQSLAEGIKWFLNLTEIEKVALGENSLKKLQKDFSDEKTIDHLIRTYTLND